jgi:signal transduction histidine kinase
VTRALPSTLAATSTYKPRLRRRLLLAFSGYALLVCALFGLLALSFAYVVEDEFFASALRAEAGRQRGHRAAQGRWTEPVLPFVRLYPGAAGLPVALARRAAAGPHVRELAGEDGRHYHLLRLDVDGSWLVADVDEQLVVRSLRGRLLGWLAGLSLALTLLAVALGWALARRSSAPLERLARRVARSGPEALPRRLADGLAHDEVGELARHLDALHERVRAFVAREQAFTTDVSHELRTPLAVMGIACERLGDGAAPPDRALLASVQASLWQLGQTVDLLLALAREEDAAPRGVAPARPLLPMVEQLVLAHAPLLDRHGIELSIEVPPQLTRPWSPALAQLLLGNLLANAIAHATSGAVRVVADAERVSVCNASGPPPAALLQDDAAGRTPGLKGAGSAGHGLGLSILRRLAARHGLALDLRHENGQTCASLRAAGD